MENILLVEDDLNLIDGLEYSLKKNGFNVDIARTVQEAFFFIKMGNTTYWFWI
jgi:two-component system response regulator RegX3